MNNPTRIVFVGDIHADADQLPGGSYRNNNACREINISAFTHHTIPWIKECCKKHSADAVVFTGDIFHSGKPYISDALAVKRGIESLDMQTYVISGNHDIIGITHPDQNPLVTLFSDSANIHVVAGNAEVVKIGSVSMTCLPWPYAGTTSDTLVRDCAPGDIITGHAQIGYGKKSLSASLLREKWSYGFFGDSHTPTYDKIMYIGASQQTSLQPGDVYTSDCHIVVFEKDKNNTHIIRETQRPHFVCRVVTDSNEDISYEDYDGIVISHHLAAPEGQFVTRRRGSVTSAERKSSPVVYDTAHIKDMIMNNISNGVDPSIVQRELDTIL